MRRVFLLLAALAATAPAAAQTRPVAAFPHPHVDVALVLLSDVSSSVNEGEFHLEKEGYRTAFADPDVIAAIRSGFNGRVAIAYVEFAGARQQHVVVGWTILANGHEARAFGQTIAAAPRSFDGRTSISNAIVAALALLREAPFTAQRQMIDICSDGDNNSGPAIALARDAAARAGVTVNALAMINPWPQGYFYGDYQMPGGLPKYFRDHVIGGRGSFVIAAKGPETFAQAMQRKLRLEIASK